MKYDYREGVTKAKSKKWLVIPGFTVLVGGYALVTAMAPQINSMVKPADATAQKLVANEPVKGENRLYIPKLNLDVDLASFTKSSNGTPNGGGNFALSGAKLAVGLTPFATIERSVLHGVEKLASGDDIYVDYNGVRYAYKVGDGDSDTLTLSATDSKDSVTAEPVGRIVWANGKPLLKSL